MIRGLNYTVRHDERINLFIEEKLSLIVDQILGILEKDAHAILLYGGFGREEGGVECRHDQMRIINDLDILVFTKRNFILKYAKYQGPLKSWAGVLASKFGMKLIDITLRDADFFSSKSPLTVAHYELKNGSKTLYGDFELSKLLPEYDAGRIGLDEGTTFFLKRGCGLLIAAKYMMLGRGFLERFRENCIIETQKAVIAMGDSMLIQQHRYHFSYAERLRRFRGLNYPDKRLYAMLLPQYADAIENKIRPDFIRYTRTDLSAYWFQVQSLYDQYFFLFEQGRLGRKLRDWAEYSGWILKSNTDSFSSFFSYAVQLIIDAPQRMVRPMELAAEIRRRQRSFLLSTLPLLIFSVQKTGFDSFLLNKASGLFKIDRKDHPVDKELWNCLADKWLRLFHIKPNKVIHEILSRQPSIKTGSE